MVFENCNLHFQKVAVTVIDPLSKVVGRPVVNVDVSFIFKCRVKNSLNLRCDTRTFIVTCCAVWHVQFHLQDVLTLKSTEHQTRQAG